VQDHTQGWRGASSKTRPEGAPLTVISHAERMPGTEDGLGPVFAGAPLA